MPGRVAKPLLVLTCVVLIGGCGSDDEATIPSDEASSLLALLEEVDESIASGDCERAAELANEFVGEVGDLPGEVPTRVRQGLTEAGARMATLSQDPSQCTTGATGETDAEETTAEPTTTDETTTDEDDTGDDEDSTEDQDDEQPETGGGDDGGDGGGPPPDDDGGGPPPSDGGGGGEEPEAPPGDGDGDVEAGPAEDTGGITPGERPQP